VLFVGFAGQVPVWTISMFVCTLLSQPHAAEFGGGG
jgi:hypothetical protein